MNITYDRAKISDIDVIYDICVDLVNKYEDISNIEYVKVLKWIHKKLEYQINDYKRILLDNKVVGFYHFYKNEDNDYELDDFYIIEKYHNKGIGPSVLKDLIKSVKETIVVFVFIKNEKAVNLYKSLGFKVKENIMNSRYIMTYER